MTHTYQTVTLQRKEKTQKRKMKRCGKFHFGHRGLETPKTSKFVPKLDFSWEQKVAALGAGRRHIGTGMMRTWGQEGAAPAFF